jgi:hypothetical protein
LDYLLEAYWNPGATPIPRPERETGDRIGMIEMLAGFVQPNRAGPIAGLIYKLHFTKEY